jgi:hypothetical protein
MAPAKTAMFPRTILSPGTEVSIVVHRASYPPVVPSSIFGLWRAIELPLQRTPM